jgi:hypothetical protein
VARLISLTVGVGESLALRVDELTELKNEESVLSTPKEKQIRSVVVSESTLREFGLSTP